MTAREIFLEARAQVREIGAEDAMERVENGAHLSDLREAEEFQAGHLPGAVNVRRGLLEFQFGTIPELMDRREPIVVYCKTSGRSLLSAVVLKRMGFSNVVCLSGGYDQWVAGGRPIHGPVPAAQ